MASDLPAPGTCKFYPAVPGRPARLDGYRNEADTGWNAGANSIKSLDGNVRLVFSQPQVQGAAMGFTESRDNPTDYARLTHAFMFRTNSIGEPTVQMMESGRAVSPVLTYQLGYTFGLYRDNGQVRYRVMNGSTVVVERVSTKPSVGSLIVGCSLYASGDSVESEETP